MPNAAFARSAVMARVAAPAARLRAAVAAASAIAAAAAFTTLAALLQLPATAAGASAAPAPALQPAAGGWPAGGEARLLRYPAIHGDKIAFVYAGDIWLVDAAGGVARRLTSHPGLELFPRFSPDGRWIAFTGEYGGNRQVFVISVEGGAPRQLTYHNDIGDLPPRGGYDNQVLGWTPDGKDVVFRANRVAWSERNGRPYLVAAAGGMERPMRIPESGNGSFSPDGAKFVYTPLQSEFRGWKRHRGGRAQDIWIYDLAADTAERILHDPATDNQPMWIGNKIYFTSDREHTLNLYSYDLATRQVAKLTQHDQYDVLWPSAGTGRIVYENGGSIYLFDPATGKSARVPIRIASDLPLTLPYWKNVRANIESADVSPTGKRAVLAARGEILTVPAEKGEVLELAATPGVRAMNPAWSPDGRWIAYLSDRSGEYEIWVRDAGGAGAERRVTTDGDIWRFPPAWSPDSRKLAFGDRKQHLRWVEVASGKVADVDHSSRADITTYAWSPDSRFIAYTKLAPSQLSTIWIYGLDDGRAQQLSGELAGETEPVFDPAGHYLYFLSNRDFQLTFSGFETDYLYTRPTRVYVALLAKDGPALFLPESDDEPAKAEPESKEGKESRESKEGKAGKAGKEAKEAKAGKAGEAPAAPPRVRIDVPGFEQRVRALPAAAADYSNLQASAEAVFYLAGTGAKAQLKMYDLKDRKESVVLEGVAAYQLSADGKKVLFKHGEDWGIADAKPAQKNTEGLLPLDKLQIEIHPREEWRQMYYDAWRIMRDWFYDPGMHGVDWAGMRDRYGALLPYVGCRDDLDYLLEELGAELSAGHVYVSRGDEPEVPRVEGGLLGAEIEADPSGVFRIARIFPGENWQEDFRSPLTEPGVHVEAGEYILAVDGQPTRGVDNFYRLLENKAGHVVVLRVAASPGGEGARDEKVRPVKSEQGLRYYAWVQANRERVDRASGGRIGYIHLPDTAVAGNRELFKYFYPQVRKEALILDDRYNGGGFIPDRMVALLSRPLLNYWVSRGVEPTTTPGFVNTGPKACLINGSAGSGGDAFPYYFRKLGLGPLIGTKTWGGLIGLSGNPPLLDGGSLSTPTFRFLDTEGHWGVENVGVLPDIEVVDRPDEIAKGHDPSLERAVAYLMQELAKHPPAKVTVPPIPAAHD
ncbi:MAG TPA: PDZ domain-containing protein [Thermoanaerobaculia bacterium]|nr:PDZ domain-containing protein [Thermoanaerobaculia bacterium]